MLLNNFYNSIIKKTIIIIILILIPIFSCIKYWIKKEEIKKEKGVVLCTIGKSENLYIKEYIEYYKKIGVNKIYLYDNNEINGENFKNVIHKEIDSGFIEIINIRGNIKVQEKSYNDCYYKNRKKYDWIMFFDIDEFLYIENNQIKV